MNVILILLVTGVLIIDFTKLDKNTKTVTYVYITIVVIALLIAAADKYDFVKTSPIEAGIIKMKPVTDWIEKSLM